MDSFCRDTVSSFFDKNPFVQNKLKQVLQTIEADTSISNTYLGYITI